MDVHILLKAKGKNKEQRSHYDKCPSCGNENYMKLSVCHMCSMLVCNSCKEKHN